MAKISPFTLTRPERQTQDVTLTDPNQPGVEIKITLRTPDAVDLHMIQQEAQAAASTYLGPNAIPFPPVAGDLIQLSQSLIESAATMKVLQVGPEEDRYTIEEWIALAATMPVAWSQLSIIGDQLTLNGPLGKAAKGLLEASPSLQSSTPNVIQNLISASTSYSGQSTNDSLDSPPTEA